MRKIILVLILLLIPMVSWAKTDHDMLVAKAQQFAAISQRELARYYHVERENIDKNQTGGGWCVFGPQEIGRSLADYRIYGLLRLAAEQGDLTAQFILGDFCRRKAVDHKDNVNLCIMREAVEWLELAAFKGHPVAMYQLSNIYSKDRLEMADYGEAIYWLTRALDVEYAVWQGADLFGRDPKGEYYYWAWADLRRMLKVEFVFPDKLSEADFFTWIQQKATEGNAEAIYTLGMMYFGGILVERDYIRARELMGEEVFAKFTNSFEPVEDLEQRVTAGDAGAAVELALNYMEGYTVRRNKSESERWLKKFVELDGSPAAKVLMGDFCSQAEEAFKWYLSAAESGEVVGQYKTGMAYLNGAGTNRKYEKAKDWLQKAASQEMVTDMPLSPLPGLEDLFDFNNYRWGMASYQLGLLYLEEAHEPANHSKALKLLKNAAAAENYEAMLLLGEMYETGMGVEQNFGEAAKWYAKIVEDWFGVDKDTVITALLSLAGFYETGRGVEPNAAEAFELYKTADVLGQYPEVQYALMQAYFRGNGVESDDLQTYLYAAKLAENPGATSEMVENARMIMARFEPILTTETRLWLDYRLRKTLNMYKIDYKYCNE